MKLKKTALITNHCRDYIDLFCIVASIVISFIISESIKSIISEAIANQRGDNLIGGELFIYSAIFAALFYILFQVMQITGHYLAKLFYKVCSTISEI